MWLWARSILAVVVAGALLTGCDDDAGKSVVALVGQRPITKRALQGWMAVVAPEHAVPDPPRYSACVARQNNVEFQSLPELARQECDQHFRAIKQQALSELISAAWLVEEARHDGLSISGEAIASAVASHRQALASIGANDEDVKLKVEAELAAAQLRRWLQAHRPTITRSEAARYYRRHLKDFERPEWRNFYIAENFTLSQAHRFLEEVTRGRKHMAASALHESFPRSAIATVDRAHKTAMRAIFDAEAHVLSGPVKLNGSYAVFEVTRTTPRRVRPFAQVAASLEAQLAQAGLERFQTRFLTIVRQRWTTNTSCQPGYVVQKCREYRGTHATEETPGLD